MAYGRMPEPTASPEEFEREKLRQWLVDIRWFGQANHPYTRLKEKQLSFIYTLAKTMDLWSAMSAGGYSPSTLLHALDAYPDFAFCYDALRESLEEFTDTLSDNVIQGAMTDKTLAPRDRINAAKAWNARRGRNIINLKHEMDRKAVFSGHNAICEAFLIEEAPSTFKAIDTSNVSRHPEGQTVDEKTVHSGDCGSQDCSSPDRCGEESQG